MSKKKKSPVVTYKSPDPRMEINDREFFMSYGLLNELAANVEADQGLADGGIPRPETMALSAIGRELILYTLLVQRDDFGRPVLPEDVDPEDVGRLNAVIIYETRTWGVDDVEALLEWGMRHAVDFFMRRLTGLSNRVVEEMLYPLMAERGIDINEIKDQMQTKLSQSLNDGQDNSVSTKWYVLQTRSRLMI